MEFSFFFFNFLSYLFLFFICIKTQRAGVFPWRLKSRAFRVGCAVVSLCFVAVAVVVVFVLRLRQVVLPVHSRLCTKRTRRPRSDVRMPVADSVSVCVCLCTCACLIACLHLLLLFLLLATFAAQHQLSASTMLPTECKREGGRWRESARAREHCVVS